MLEVSQRNLANITAQIADVKYACHKQNDMKRQLVWALREHCVPLLVQKTLDDERMKARLPYVESRHLGTSRSPRVAERSWRRPSMLRVCRQESERDTLRDVKPM